MIRILLVLFVSACSILACKQDATTANGQRINRAVPQQNNGTPADPVDPMPIEEIRWMIENIDQIDYEYDNMPISMALSEKGAVQNNVSYISPSVQWDIPTGCKPIGRQLFYSKANLIYEADLYFDNQCRFLVFKKDGKKVFQNKISKHGQKFYENVFSQVTNMKR